MNDKELLRLAAKAAGLIMSEEWDCAEEGRGIIIWRGDGDLRPWNPLADDGEAFRFIVELKLELTVFRDHVTAFHATSWCDELHGDDHFAATRRAIVRAAAEVGSLKP